MRPPGPGGRYRIRFGARRYRAALRAGLTEIRAIVQHRGLTPAEALLEQLIENEQREGLTTAELAAAVDRLLELDVSQAEIAERLGRSRAQISMLAAVREMAPELRALAPQLGARTLYELHSAWKADPGRTKVWLAGRDAQAITQAEARELAGRPVSSRQVVSEAVAPPFPSSAGCPPALAERKLRAAKSRAARTAVFEVLYRDMAAALVLNDVKASSVNVTIRLSSGEVIEAPAADVRLTGVRPG